MKKEIQFPKGIIPTVISFDTETNDYIIGDEAKEGGLRGRTNAFNFKQFIGSPDSIYKKPNQLWIAPDGSANTSTVKLLSYEEATKIFLKKLIDRYETPNQLNIGIPAIPEENWINYYKEHIRAALRDIGLPAPRFIWEPFAVFQTFKASKVDLEFRSKSILIIDIGGSTFNTCIVRTTGEGRFSASSASGRPVGIKSSLTGGVHIDKRLLRSWIVATKSMVKEDSENILESKNINSYLYSMEKVKIALSSRYMSKSTKSEDREKIVEEFDADSPIRKDFPLSNPSVSVQLLLEAIRKTVSESWIPQLQGTIDSAKASLLKSGMSLEKIDYVVLAGGSSQLPILVDEMTTSPRI